jgi:hypothetical protein
MMAASMFINETSGQHTRGNGPTNVVNHDKISGNLRNTTQVQIDSGRPGQP